MKSRKIKGKRWFIASGICYFLSALSIFLLPFSRKMDSSEMTVIGYFAGFLFWIGILCGIWCFSVSWVKIKDLQGYQSWREKSRLGVLSFFRGKGGIFVDIGFLVSLMALILSDYIMGLPSWIVLIFLFGSLYFFYLHFLLNGKVYRYLFEEGKEIKNEKKKQED